SRRRGADDQLYRDRRDVADHHPCRVHPLRHRHRVCRSSLGGLDRGCAEGGALTRRWPHVLRRAALSWGIALTLMLAATPARADAAFTRFVASLWPDAREAGITRATFEAETRGLAPDYKLPDLVLPGRAPSA